MGNFTVNIVNNTFKNNTAKGKSYNVYVANESKLISENNTPKNIIPTGFKSLAELINDCEGNILILDGDYWFNPDTDSELIDGVVIDKDNFTLDGQDHTINGLGQARILGVSGENVTIKNINFINGYAADYNGGAIYFIHNATVENCSFINNTADVEGGAIYFTEFGSIIDSTFEDNHALRWAGAVYFNHAGIVDNSQFINNTADIYAGALHFIRNGTVIDSNFTQNNAARQAGAISFTTNGTISNSKFTANHAGTDGGAVFINHNAVIRNAEFTSNTADESGGAIYANHGNLDIEDIIFNANAAGDYSSNIYLGETMNFTYSNVTPENFVTRNFKSLAYAISNCEGNTLTLTTDYNYDHNTDYEYDYETDTTYDYVKGIIINRDNFVIDGQGHTIDGLGLARIFYVNSTNVTFKNINFINGKSNLSGGAINSVVLNGNITVESCNFTNNTGSFGGAICIDNEGNLIINNSIFTNNTANCGGAVYTIFGTITNSKFTANSAVSCAAVYIRSGSVDNCIFTDNDSGDSGAIYFYADGTVTSSVFTNNIGAYGGAIQFEGNGTVKDSNFTGNNAKYYPAMGGAIYFKQEGTVENSRFTDNHANEGGSIYFTENGTVTNSVFTNNTGGTGGAIYFKGNGTVKDSNFTGNDAKKNLLRAGAIYFKQDAIVENSQFTDNHAETGGAIFIDGFATIKDSIFTNNTADTYGGAIYIQNNGSVSGSVFNGNDAYEGGAISALGDLSISDSEFTSNAARLCGGAIFAGADNVDLENIIFKNNTASKYTENIIIGYGVTLTFNNITPNDFITRNFESLRFQIENCKENTLVLNCDYAHYTIPPYEDITQIPIARDNFTIDGQGHTIDAVGLAGIFHITGNNVTLKNINFINGLREMDAGAIFSDVENRLLIIDNCNFTNNTGMYGAIKINQEGKLIVSNSNFNNNEGFYTGAISAHDIILTNSKFQSNKASQENRSSIRI